MRAFIERGDLLTFLLLKGGGFFEGEGLNRGSTVFYIGKSKLSSD